MLSFGSFLEAFNIRALLDTPGKAYNYAKSKEERTPELEELIATSAVHSYCYARDVLKGRFELGELAIAKEPRCSWDYVRNVLHGPFPLGEKWSFSKDPNWAFLYAHKVLGGKFELGEPIIATDPPWAYEYAKEVLKGPFPLGEAAIAADPQYKKLYDEFLASLDKG